MITLQAVTGSGRSCPTCPQQESTWYNYQSYLPARDGRMSLSAVPDISRRNARNALFATANVGTLLDSHCAKGDDALDGRVQFFDLCFNRAELDVVAVQASREHGDSHRPDLPYERFCASADTVGCFGAQIWIRRSSGVVSDAERATRNDGNTLGCCIVMSVPKEPLQTVQPPTQCWIGSLSS